MRNRQKKVFFAPLLGPRSVERLPRCFLVGCVVRSVACIITPMESNNKMQPTFYFYHLNLMHSPRKYRNIAGQSSPEVHLLVTPMEPYAVGLYPRLPAHFR